MQNLFLILGVFCLLIIQDISGSQQPNILLVVADDYGFHDIGYHGSEILTPTLDKLAGEGVKLENYYVQPICSPTRSQLLSGRYQIHTGLQHAIIWPCQPNALPLEDPTLADKLRQTGYATHAVGKWHLGFYKEEYLPINRGFDSYFGYLTGSEDYFKHDTCNFLTKEKYCGIDMTQGRSPDITETGKYSTHLFTERAIDIVKNHNKSKPLFLYMPYQAVHEPLEVPAKYMNPYEFIQDENRRTYAGMVSCLDEGVKNLTNAFQEAGLWDNTILIFTTDNGGLIYSGGNNWPLRGWKATLWEGGVHGIGFVHSQLLKQKGVVNKDLIHVSDWFPTIINLAGGSLNDTKPDGFDQWKTISEGEVGKRTELLHNIDPIYYHRGSRVSPNKFDTRIRTALRLGDWKLMTGDPGNGSWIAPPEIHNESRLDPSPKDKNVWLFNIPKDPNENHDLSEEYPDIVDKMLDRLSYYSQTAVPVRFPEADPNCNPALRGGVWGPWG
ncbi:hypothetical protein SNE40_010544 [Patella caerulea]|uniref:Sulfatase N-terminal domain-containing protein n=1 Tax=Patella caerulea TaxID=87958 RepID=A0AAN8Q541_PATCE